MSIRWGFNVGGEIGCCDRAGVRSIEVYSQELSSGEATYSNFEILGERLGERMGEN